MNSAARPPAWTLVSTTTVVGPWMTHITRGMRTMVPGRWV